MPGENVLAHTAHMYQPGTRRPYGVLEWPAMLRRLDAEQKNSGLSAVLALKNLSNPGDVMLTLLSRLMMAASLLFALAPNASADDYPNRPVRLIIPFPPGGSNDVVGRLVAQQLSAKLGQQVYVDNRGGAGGTIGTEACANTTPDGYTICVISIAHAVNPALYSLKYDPIKSFTPISIFATGQRARGQPDVADQVGERSHCAGQGETGFTQLRIGGRRQLPASGRRIVQAAGPGRHCARTLQRRRPAMQDVIGGHVKIMFSSLVQTTPFIKSGQLIALGTGRRQASPVVRDVPTIAEAGLPGYVADNWWGLAAPAGLPQPLADKLYPRRRRRL